jgi:site-specific DNA-methyltransferase (adenine-specific)
MIEIDVKTTKYGNLIPISKADYEALKDMIRKDRKLHYPILINQHRDVLDGHNRLKICQELAELEGIIVEELRFETIHFDNDLEEERFVRIINANRRHMNDYQKAKQALALEHIESKLARQRQISSGKTQTPLSPNEPKRRGRVKEIVSKAVNLPPTTYFRAKTIIQKGSEEANKKLEEGKSEITTEYNKLVRTQKRLKAREEAASFAESLNLPSKVMLLNKDSTKIEELATEIADNSVDLIITDPPYLKEYLSVFEGLANFAARKLKEGGYLIFYYGHPHLPELIRLFSKYEELGLYYAWQLAIIHTGSQARFHCLGVQVGWKPMLWYRKGKKKYDSHKPAWQPDLCDVIYSAPPDKTAHDWAQSPVEAEYIIKHLTINEHSLVVDPFLGSGAFAIPAIKLDRYFIGIEIDKQVFESAKNNVMLTQQQRQQEEENNNNNV